MRYSSYRKTCDICHPCGHRRHFSLISVSIYVSRGLDYKVKPMLNSMLVNTLRPRHNGRRFADDTFKRIFLNENVRISIKISLKFVPKGPINNIPALLQIMAWRRSGDKPLSEPMTVRLLTHICVTRPQGFSNMDFDWLATVLPANQMSGAWVTKEFPC